jgi:hypothetical protein
VDEGCDEAESVGFGGGKGIGRCDNERHRRVFGDCGEGSEEGAARREGVAFVDAVPEVVDRDETERRGHFAGFGEGVGEADFIETENKSADGRVDDKSGSQFGDKEKIENEI